MLRSLRHAIPLVFALVVMWVSHQERLPGGVMLPHPLDKLVHGAVYGVMGFLANLAWGGPRRGLVVLFGVAAFAATDEWHQSFIPGREASLLDWGADVVGAGAGVFLASLFKRSPRSCREN